MNEGTSSGCPSRPYRVAVFCSANAHIQERFFSAATSFAQGLARRGWELIYGGAQAGLMGHFADEALKAGGVVRGAIPGGATLAAERPHPRIQELVMVGDMFERKRWFMLNSDAFVVFPGGFGTLDEALEVITWKSIRCLEKPILFVNLEGFWQNQLQTFEEFARQGMIRSGGLDLYEVHDSLESVWKSLDATSEIADPESDRFDP